MTQPTIVAGEITLRPFAAEVGNTASRRVAVLRRRLVHRGVRVDAWIGSVLPDEIVPSGVTIDTPGVGGSVDGGLG